MSRVSASMIQIARRTQSLALGLSAAALVFTQDVSAESWYTLEVDPQGKTRNVPLQLEPYPLGGATERQYPPNLEFTLWVQDEALFQPKQDDKVEIQKVLEKKVDTIKLQDAVPPIGFASGEADIPDAYIERLRTVLTEMKNRQNVRLHFVGHSDTDSLSAPLRAKFGDNIGLSRYRAQTAAEYFQRQLGLPPDGVSFDGVGASKPIASNDTEAGKRLNRRVEVQVWYDEVKSVAVEKKVVIPAEKANRIKVCRKETVCKLSYKDGSARRIRLQNLVNPFRLETGQAGVPDEFIRRIRETLANLSDKRNVEIRFVGHTDNLPLQDNEKRIYRDQENLSKARARYVMLEVQDRLRLPNSAVSSSGKGYRFPVASNNSEKGRSMNRRVEIEFWYDDPFEEYSEEPEACPEAAGSETITRTYDPPSGPIRAISYESGNPVIPSGLTTRLARIMKEIEDKANVRLSFIGYTANERLDRRTAMVYGDDIGLSRSRAERAMKIVQQDMGLSDQQVEFDGRGYVHSDDVINTGFIQFDGSRVEIKVLYDELALLEDQENLVVDRIERESVSKNPYALNLMRITVDGQPLYDPYRNTEDIQRCTDVALEAADIQFKFNQLHIKPRLNITAWPSTVRYNNNEETSSQENLVRFKMYSNYANFIKSAEVRIFEYGAPTTGEPLAVVPIDRDNNASWLAEFDKPQGAVQRLIYLLRVYDEQGHYDETVGLPLWVVDELQASTPEPEEGGDTVDDASGQALLAGYGENHLDAQRIRLEGGTVTVFGKNIPADHKVWFAGRQVPINNDGEFVAEQIFPKGLHTIEVAVLDDGGSGELYLRDLGFDDSDWFYVGVGDLTISYDDTSGPARLVTQDEHEYNNETHISGRMAYYVEGEFGDDWRLISSADTREGPVEDLFSNFLDKDPQALLRRLDPDLYYPTFADDSSLEERAPTSGKVYVKLQRHESYGILGNFTIDYLDTSLAQIDRGLYGLNGHYQEQEYTPFGEERFVIDGFAADPGTVSGRDEFRGTGGSLYYLRHQDILTGSERLRIEVRDRASGIVLSARELVPAIDYDLDYIQGRILLSQPLSSIAADDVLISDSSLSGNPVYLVARYEYTPGLDEIDTVALGARTHFWIDDQVKLGATLSSQEQDQLDNQLQGIDLTYRQSTNNWVRLEVVQTEGAGASALNSIDGGFSFDDLSLTTTESKSDAYRLEGAFKVDELFSAGKGRATFYVQENEAGFSAPGQLTQSDVSLFGTRYRVDITDQWDLDVKLDTREQDEGLKTESMDVTAGYQADQHWRYSGGVGIDQREDNSLVVPSTQKQGDRVDLAAELHYDSLTDWSAYGYAQATASKDDGRDDNHRVGGGGDYRVNDRLKLNGDLSFGEMGTGISAGMEYLYSDLTNVYSAYTLENSRSDNGLRSRQGNWNTGMRSRFSDSLSVYGEERYSHGDVPTGLTHTFGVDYAANERWNYGASIEAGTLENPDTGAELDRTSLGLSAAYNFGEIILTSALEYRVDKTQQEDLSRTKRDTWLMKNNFKYRINPDWRFIAKANAAKSTSSEGNLYDSDYSELVLGYGYRPVDNDRLNTLFKYTYFYNLPFGNVEADPLTGQVTALDSAVELIQKSHILSLDAIYDLTERWSIGGKLAHRLGEFAYSRETEEFFKSRANLYILRADWHFTHRWDAIIEARLLDLPDAEDTRSGALLGLYRHVGENLKLGIGYNFTDFSDDLTDVDYDSSGVFINIVGKI